MAAVVGEDDRLGLSGVPSPVRAILDVDIAEPGEEVPGQVPAVKRSEGVGAAPGDVDSSGEVEPAAPVQERGVDSRTDCVVRVLGMFPWIPCVHSDMTS